MKPAFDFKAMTTRARGMAEEGLRYSIADCKKAIDANPVSENVGYYLDEIHTYVAEIIRRRGQKGKK
jgi:hypothetical protein